MFHIIACTIWVVIAWRWGDWRNWKTYQATILFMILGDLLHNFLLFQHPLWVYTPVPPFANHTLINLLIMFVLYPSALFIYLPHYPNGIKQVWYVLAWLCVWGGIEWILLRFNLMKYYDGWRFLYSLVFDLFIFFMMRLHQKKPLWAYGVAVVFTIAFLSFFHVRIEEMK